MAAPTWLDKLTGQALRIAGVAKSPTSKIWNFVSGVSATYNAATGAWDLTVAGGSGGHVIEEEGTPLTQRANLNFVGVNVAVADSGGKTVVTIGAVDLASGVTGTLPYTRGGTGLGTLGTAGQSYRVNAGATGVEWYTPSAGLAAPANPGDNGKVATASAGNLSYILITHSNISASAAIALTQLADGTALSLVGRSANSTGPYGDIVAGVDGHVLRRSGTTLGFGTLGTSSYGDDTVTFAKIQNIATNSLVGRDTAGTGDAENILLDAATLEMDGSGNLRVPSQLGARGSENVIIDAYPSQQAQGTIANAATVTATIAIASGKRYNITADVWVDDGAGGAVIFTKFMTVIAHQTGGAAVLVMQSALDNGGAGFTFDVSVSTTNVVFSLINASGSTRSYNLTVGSVVMDKP